MSNQIIITSIAANLTAEREGGGLLGSNKLDPYVVFELNGQRGQTRAVKNAGREVEWQEPIHIEGVSSPSGNLTLAVYNHNTLRSDNLVGSGHLRVSELRDGPQRVTLQPPGGGGSGSSSSESPGQLQFTIESGGALGRGRGGGATSTGSGTTTGSPGSTASTGTAAGTAAGTGGIAAAGGAGSVGRGTGTASNPGTDQSGYAGTGTGTGTGYGAGAGTNVGRDAQAVRGTTAATAPTTRGSSAATSYDEPFNRGRATTGGSKTGIGADDEVPAPTQGVRDLNLGSQERATQREAAPSRETATSRETTTTTRTTGASTGAGTGVGTTAIPGVPHDFTNYKFKETHGRNTEEFLSYKEGIVCDSRTYTVIEDRPVEREIITRVLEHRPVEKTFVVETRPVGEREVLAQRHVESVGTTSRVVEATEASSPCEGHPEVEASGARVNVAGAGTGTGTTGTAGTTGASSTRTTRETTSTGGVAGTGAGTTTGSTTRSR